MPSLKSHLVALVLRHTRKKAFRSAEGLHRWIARSRPVQNHRPPADVRGRMDVVERSTGGFPVHEVRAADARDDIHLLYLHGGAYCFEMTAFHWRLIERISRETGLNVTVPIYPLAPEHRFDEIYAMTRTVYREVAQRSGGRFAIAGDSAGGNMALVLTMMAAQEGLPLPRRLVLLSPTLDMTMGNPDVEAAARRDPWLDIPGGLESVRIYAGDMERGDWRLSPTYGDLAILPPTLLFCGTREMLHPDTIRFVEKARMAGVELDYVEGRGMIHVWPLIDMPEAEPARQRIVAFLRTEEAPPA